jgi:hypothetical protein
MGVHEGVKREIGQFCKVCSATDCGCVRNAELVRGESFKETGAGAPELGTEVALAQIGRVNCAHSCIKLYWTPPGDSNTQRAERA